MNKTYPGSFLATPPATGREGKSRAAYLSFRPKRVTSEAERMLPPLTPPSERRGKILPFPLREGWRLVAGVGSCGKGAVGKGFLLLFVLLFLRSAPAHAVTKYDAMTARLRADCAARPLVLHLYNIGISSRDMRPIWMVRVASPKPSADLRKNLRLLVICRQHGDEPVSTEAAIAAVHHYATCKLSELPSALSNVTLYIIPMANPDGAGNLQRDNGMGADMNRDWGPFTTSETQAIYIAFKQIRPQVVVDMHSWTPGDPYQTSCVEIPRGDAGVLPNIATQSQSLQNAHNPHGDGER